MAEEIKVTEQQFNQALDYIKINPNVDRSVFYALFVDALDAAEGLKEYYENELVAKGNRMQELIDLIDEKEMRWLELSEKL